MAFLTASIRRPRQIGAIAQSSRALARIAAAPVPVTDTPTVVELGPGAGVVSDAIARRLPRGGRHIAVEIDPGMARHLRRTRPWLHVLDGDAARLRSLLNSCDVDRADAVISALPWTRMPAHVQQRILEEIHATLNPGCRLSTIITLSAWPFASCRRFRRLLEHTIGPITVLGPVWRNMPPALVLTCPKARHV
ncbi:methyltransferase domain-containing protein [Nonomuraea sp. NPDC049784]|uniref:class I SAM-dependent methyltransferase n=1 Tax=Nonomuraea sp. NPDC049784 TaxID=3154361 RepID=UPI0033E37C83